MTNNHRIDVPGSLGVIAASLLAVSALLLSGCGGSNAHAVDTSQARDALVSALDHWKKGDAPRSITEMTIQDMDWERGAKLLDYQIVGDGQARDANLSIKAKLTLAGEKPGSRNVEKTVNYLVGTSPSVTVFRDMLKR